MNADGSGAHQLVANDDRQINPQFTPDDRAVVYSQDRGGDEYYDIYEVPVNGGEPRNLTNTPDISETVRHFSPGGKLLVVTVKQKTAPSTNLAVMEWPGGSIHQLTHSSRNMTRACSAIP
jgi:Tol biopolymer transport system component